MTHSPGPPAVTDVQPHVLEVQYKAETGTPKQVLKTLKRAYSSSVSCFETHIRLSSYQATLNKKLARKTLSDDDIQQIRRICENLVYIIQGPHDRNTYSVTLRLLSNVASSSDPVAFILCERHISSILRRVLEVSTDLPGPKVAALLQLLDHVHIRHRLSETRQRLSNAVRGQYPSADDISAAEEGCRELIELVRSASQTEIWVKMMVQDLLYLVAKQPNISFVLLEPSIYPHVAKIATRLDSENIRPLCETLVTYATDPNLSKFHDSAIESLIDLTSSPPPCATVLLEPQFAKRIGGIARSPLRDRPLPNSQAVVASEPDQQFNVSELVRRMSVLALQEELRGNIPRLLALSDHPSPFRLQKVDKEEYQELIDKLLFLYRQKQQDSATFRIIIKSFLIIATGNDIGLDFLINSGSDVIRYLREASSSSLSPNIRTISGSEVVFDMLHDLVRHLEIDADQLLQRSPPLRSRHSIDRSRFNDTFENENDLDRAQALCWRLINICRLDLVNQFTSSALELLGSLVKSSETAYTLFSIDSKLRDALGALGEQNEALTSSVGRIVKLLDDDLIS
ncbi:hypothetical protein FRC20_008809 [Serendipita sp. 405]|nr:hypothetical protein FRC20_008809 [Serendipita sp. 405]